MMHTCVLCGVQYPVPVHLQGYLGLCPSCWSKDTLREWDRIESARKRLAPGTPDTLTLAEWLAIAASWQGCCALCGLNSFNACTLFAPAAGLVADNVFPSCRACHLHFTNGFAAAINRVSAQLAIAPLV